MALDQVIDFHLGHREAFSLAWFHPCLPKGVQQSECPLPATSQTTLLCSLRREASRGSVTTSLQPGPSVLIAYCSPLAPLAPAIPHQVHCQLRISVFLFPPPAMLTASLPPSLHPNVSPWRSLPSSPNTQSTSLLHSPRFLQSSSCPQHAFICLLPGNSTRPRPPLVLFEALGRQQWRVDNPRTAPEMVA